MTSEQTTAFIKIAQGLQPWIVDIRHHLHQIPEISWQEEETLAFIRSTIKETKESATRSPQPAIAINEAKGGIWVDVTFSQDLDRILLRADIDALPIEEQTGLSFSSQNPGVMHACGHDTHAAMLLGALKALLENTMPANHNLRFVFQRAEENPLKGSGGATLVKEGVLQQISEAFALHVWAPGEPGHFLSRPGPMTANSDRLKILIQCTGGHVASPQLGSNAIDIATDIQNALRGFDTRTLGPNEPVSLVPAIFQAGNAGNIRPSEAELWFAVRNVLGPEKREAFHNAIADCVKAVATRYPDANVTVTPKYGHPTMANTTQSYEKVKAMLEGAGQETSQIELVMGGEDFAHYLELLGGVPGSMWFLGAGQQDSGGHHAPTFNPDESVFWKGVLFWLLLACEMIDL